LQIKWSVNFTRLLQDFGFSLIRKRSYLGISLGSTLLTLDTSVVSSRSRSFPRPFALGCIYVTPETQFFPPSLSILLFSPYSLSLSLSLCVIFFFYLRDIRDLPEETYFFSTNKQMSRVVRDTVKLNTTLFFSMRLIYVRSLLPYVKVECL